MQRVSTDGMQGTIGLLHRALSLITVHGQSGQLGPAGRYLIQEVDPLQTQLLLQTWVCLQHTKGRHDFINNCDNF